MTVNIIILFLWILNSPAYAEQGGSFTETKVNQNQLQETLQRKTAQRKTAQRKIAQEETAQRKTAQRKIAQEETVQGTTVQGTPSDDIREGSGGISEFQQNDQNAVDNAVDKDGFGNDQAQEQEFFDQFEVLNSNEITFYDAYRVFIYDPGKRPSPFLVPMDAQSSEVVNTQKAVGVLGLKAYDIQAFKVTSLIWDVSTPRALVLDPSGQSHRVEVGTEIGVNDGYVAKIREGELIVIEKQKIYGDDGKKKEFFRTQVLKITR